MKCNLEKRNDTTIVLNVGDVFITKKGNPHMVIYNNFFNVKHLQVLKLSGDRQARVIKCFSSMKELIENYEIAEVINSRDLRIERR
jgi:hypothetical protein